jgi:menaquinone-9 beta-reductase
MSAETVAEIAIVGGGPAGAALAIELADKGHDVALFERLPRPRWRAAGVYSSPLARRRLRALGLTEPEVSALIRPIPAMVVETADGTTTCRLDYEQEPACGVDRVRLEERLLARARAAGARVHEGTAVRQVHLGEATGGVLVSSESGPRWWRACLIVGADGPSSMVARAAGVVVPTRRFRRAALTGHRYDAGALPAGQPMDAQMVVGDGWYLGIAPVPGGRVNLGLVLSEAELRRNLGMGRRPELILDESLAKVVGPSGRWLHAPRADELQAHLPLAHRVGRVAGATFLLVGDAAGFIDPLSGEGLHRAFASAAMASQAIARWSRGEPSALSDYDRRLRARFQGKDLVSWLLQLFLVQPHLARYALARLARRPDLRRDFAQGMADLAPASRLLDPRFHLRLLAP